jgi:hypothetical protein
LAARAYCEGEPTLDCKSRLGRALRHAFFTRLCMHTQPCSALLSDASLVAGERYAARLTGDSLENTARCIEIQ